MSSIPEEYIDYIDRVVKTTLDQMDDINVRWHRGVTRINDSEWSEVNYGVTVCTSTTRPTAYDGRPIYETDTNKYLIYNGASWVEISGGGGSGDFMADGSVPMTGDLSFSQSDPAIMFRPGDVLQYDDTLQIHEFKIDGNVVASFSETECNILDTEIYSNRIEINDNGSGDRNAYLDLVGDDTYNYGLRLIRDSNGANAPSYLLHHGTGDLVFRTEEAAPMYFSTNSTVRIIIDSSGEVNLSSNLDMGANNVYLDSGVLRMSDGTTLSGSIGFTTGVQNYIQRQLYSGSDYALLSDQDFMHTWAILGTENMHLSTADGLKMYNKINMNGIKIEGLPTPVADGDAARKKYVDDSLDGSFMADGSVDMTGNITFDKANPSIIFDADDFLLFNTTLNEFSLISDGTILAAFGDVQCDILDTIIRSDRIDVNLNGSGDRGAHIDLVGDDTYSDYGLRLERGDGGPNTTSLMSHRGTGGLVIECYDAAGIYFQTDNVSRMTVSPTGDVSLNSNKITSLATPTLDYDAATKKYVDDNINGDFMADGSVPMTGDLKMNFNGILNAEYLEIDHPTGPAIYFNVGGFSCGTVLISSNFLYVDSKTNGIGVRINAPAGRAIEHQIGYSTKFTIGDTSMTSAVTLAMGGFPITGLAAPTANGDAVRFEHFALDDHTNYLLIDGTRAMSGTLELAGHSIYNAGLIEIDHSTTPTIYFNASSVAQAYISTNAGSLYLNSSVNDFYLQVPTGKTIYNRVSGSSVFSLSGSGHVSTQPLAMGSNKITGLAVPTADYDAATKKYVDDNSGGSSQAFQNMFVNGNFDSWNDGITSAPDGWDKTAAGTIARAAAIEYGTYCVALTRAGTSCYLLQDIAISEYAGKTVTVGVWIKDSNASNSKITVYDGVGATYSAWHTGSGDSEFITVTRTLDASATVLRTQIYNQKVDGTIHIDGAIIVEGSSAIAFSPKPLYDTGGILSGELEVMDTVINADSVEINENGSGNRYAYVDLIGDDTYSDYGLRLIRYNTGANALSELTHRGTGALRIETIEAAELQLATAGSSRITLGSTGIITTAGPVEAGDDIDMNDNDILGANVIQATTSQSLTLKVSSGQSIIFQAA